MTILHIANSYGGTSVYTNLYTAIDANADVVQWVYVPLNSRNHDRVGNKMIDFRNEGSEIHYSTLLKPYHKYLYGLRIRTIVKDVEQTFDMRKVDAIHAGTLCLDGAVAYELGKKYNIPYIVAVRNTDASYYQLKWRHGYFTKIMEKASKVVFISPKFKDLFIAARIPETSKHHIEKNVMVIPNGISKVFLDNRNSASNSFDGKLNMIFVAAFYKGKGLMETILAIEKLRGKGYDITLNAIGKGLPNRPHDKEYEAQVDALAKGKGWVKTQSFKKPEEIIAEMRKANAFIMVSKPETFGLVYVEALSQGLPIIYAQGQGFDGFYPDGFVGYPAQAGNVDSIAEKIESLIKNYPTIIKDVESLKLEEDFEWNNIAKKYITIYNTVK